MKVGRVALWCAGAAAAVGAVVVGACSSTESPANRASMERSADSGAVLQARGAAQAATPGALGPVAPGPGADAGVVAPHEELWIVPTDALAGATGGTSSGFGAASGGRGGRRGGGGGGGAGGAAIGGGGRGAGGAPSVAGGGARGGAGGRGRGVGPGLAAGSQDPALAAAALVGTGVLAARDKEGSFVTVPLKHTEVKAGITGYIATVGVEQQFTNPYAEKIEAVYVFPLPENAGVNEFVMTIGERHIRGIVRERAEAEKIYQQARAQGYQASLMTQERPNIFTQSVANIEPGKEIDISIKYFHTLTYKDGWYEWVFPMVVGPRYNPGGMTNGQMTNDKSGEGGAVGTGAGASSAGGTGIGAVPRGAVGASGQKTEVQYLKPEERSGHDIGLTVDVDAGVKVEEMVSVNHKVQKRSDGEGGEVVTLAAEDRIPNKDFVLRYRVAGEKVKTGVFVQKDENGKGGYFTVLVVPPESLKGLPRRPVEMVFVVDTSGSMSGQPIAQAKSAVETALGKMESRDTFQVVKFASGAEQMEPQPVTVNGANLTKAKQYVREMQGNGGTEMLQGINAALAFPHDEERTRVVAFLTDGYIGNEVQILKALHQQLERSRVFSFGVGSSPNRYLLDAMARVGHGTAAYLSLNESAEPVMDSYFEQISHPALANLQVEFGGGAQVTEVYPKVLPELFVGRPVILTGRYSGSVPRSVTVRGVVGNEPVRFEVPADTAEHGGISTVWARAKITDLHDQAIYETKDVSNEVKAIALEYGLMSEFTGFVAVDSTHVTAGDHGTTVAVPVPVPEGVRYDTTVK